MTKAVYKAIATVTAALSKDGITKDRKNKHQGYSFRGIDEVYNALSTKLSDAGLCILPRIISRDCVERKSSNGGALFYVTVEAEFDFVAAEDGSSHTIKTFGEAMDSSDKATNKAMSAAYKYACMQAFCIPTEGDNDADSENHTVKPEVNKADPAKERAQQMANDLKALSEQGDMQSYDGLTQSADFTSSLAELKQDRPKLADRILELMTTTKEAIRSRDDCPIAAE